jgi:RND family efflux transporter MFP subunit
MSFTHNKQKTLILFSVLMISLLMFNSCGEDKKEKIDSRSMEQIYADEGVPVRVIDITGTTLSNQMKFFATMSGIQETNLLAKIEDKIVTLPVKVGQSIKEGQIVATFPTDNVQLQWEQAKISLDMAKKTYDRMAALLKAGDIALSQFDGAETQYQVAKQTFESLKQMVYIDAPFSGIVTNIPVKVGDKVKLGTVLMTIAQTGTMVAKIWTNETEVSRLKIGMPATINIDGKEHKGRIATISLSMDQIRRAFLVEVHFANPSRDIKSGTTCDLVFNFDESAKQSIIIPRRMIKTNADEQFVFVVDGDVAKKRLIQTGQISGVNIEITSGLNVNDKLVTEGMSLLEDEKKVKIMK